MTTEINILIVEDEITLAEDIALRLRKMGYSIAGIASSVDEAELLWSKSRVDLAIVDIRLRGSRDGIDLGAIINQKYHVPFIFLTSYAVESIVERAKSVSPSAYMLKPFNDRQFQIAIEIALVNFSNNQSNAGGLADSSEKLESEVLPINDSLFLKKDNHYDRVSYEDILWLQAESNYTIVHTDRGKYVYSVVLHKMEEKLPAHLFMRVHRSHIVNLSGVSGFSGNMLHIGSHKIPVSKSYQGKVFKHFKVI